MDKPIKKYPCKAVLEEMDRSGDWSLWYVVTLLEDNENTWKVRSWRHSLIPFYIHKSSIGRRIKPL